jgi:hypothetical protein
MMANLQHIKRIDIIFNFIFNKNQFILFNIINAIPPIKFHLFVICLTYNLNLEANFSLCLNFIFMHFHIIFI